MTRADLDERIRRRVPDDAALTEVAQVFYDALAELVPYDFACIATLDPATGLGTWTSKTRDLGVGDEEFAATEYGPPDVNRFADIAQRPSPVGVLSVDTGGDLDACRRHRDFMAPRFGFTDEIRVVFRSRGAAWGAVGIYRGEGDPPFSAADGDAVATTSETMASLIQRALFRRDASVVGTAAEVPGLGPAVLIVDADDRVTHQTPAAEATIEDLGGLDHGSLPANLLNVVALARTRQEHTETVAQATSGRWLTLRAVPLAEPADRPDVVLTVEPTPRAALSRLALAAHGLTAREEDVALLVLQGANTKAIAAALFLSPHTVQDHLKTIFAKLGVNSRRELVARLVLA